jgi:hypothetical protein
MVHAMHIYLYDERRLVDVNEQDMTQRKLAQAALSQMNFPAPRPRN